MGQKHSTALDKDVERVKKEDEEKKLAARPRTHHPLVNEVNLRGAWSMHEHRLERAKSKINVTVVLMHLNEEITASLSDHAAASKVQDEIAQAAAKQVPALLEGCVGADILRVAYAERPVSGTLHDSGVEESAVLHVSVDTAAVEARQRAAEERKRYEEQRGGMVMNESINFIDGARYSQIVLTIKNKPLPWILDYGAQICKGRGAYGFFYQQHTNGHEIIGFYQTEADMQGKRVRHGHRRGFVAFPGKGGGPKTDTRNEVIAQRKREEQRRRGGAYYYYGSSSSRTVPGQRRRWE